VEHKMTHDIRVEAGKEKKFLMSLGIVGTMCIDSTSDEG
jgi:hypothetical protein